MLGFILGLGFGLGFVRVKIGLGLRLETSWSVTSVDEYLGLKQALKMNFRSLAAVFVQTARAEISSGERARRRRSSPRFERVSRCEHTPRSNPPSDDMPAAFSSNAARQSRRSTGQVYLLVPARACLCNARQKSLKF